MPPVVVTTSVEVTLTELLWLAAAETPPVVPLMVPPATLTVTAPAPFAAVPVAVMPRPPLPVTLRPA